MPQPGLINCDAVCPSQPDPARSRPLITGAAARFRPFEFSLPHPSCSRCNPSLAHKLLNSCFVAKLNNFAWTDNINTRVKIIITNISCSGVLSYSQVEEIGCYYPPNDRSGNLPLAAAMVVVDNELGFSEIQQS